MDPFFALTVSKTGPEEGTSAVRNGKSYRARVDGVDPTSLDQAFGGRDGVGGRMVIGFHSHRARAHECEHQGKKTQSSKTLHASHPVTILRRLPRGSVFVRLEFCENIAISIAHQYGAARAPAPGRRGNVCRIAVFDGRQSGRSFD